MGLTTRYYNRISLHRAVYKPSFLLRLFEEVYLDMNDDIIQNKKNSLQGSFFGLVG